MAEDALRDRIIVTDEEGIEKEFAVEALFDMNDNSYALLQSGEDIVLMQVVDNGEDEQYLVPIEDKEEAAWILDAYEIAVDAAPAE
jgi:uncharacterized protein YrzB (UPF0473 family)